MNQNSDISILHDSSFEFHLMGKSLDILWCQLWFLVTRMLQELTTLFSEKKNKGGKETWCNQRKSWKQPIILNTFVIYVERCMCIYNVILKYRNTVRE